jgi:hypothetical protein
VPAHEGAECFASCAGERQVSGDRLESGRDAVAENADGEQRKPHQLQQDGESEIQEVDQKRKRGLQQLLRSQRDDNQRQDDDVVDAGAEAFRRRCEDAVVAIVAQSLLQGVCPWRAEGTLSQKSATGSGDGTIGKMLRFFPATG